MLAHDTGSRVVTKSVLVTSSTGTELFFAVAVTVSGVSVFIVVIVVVVVDDDDDSGI